MFVLWRVLGSNDTINRDDVQLLPIAETIKAKAAKCYSAGFTASFHLIKILIMDSPYQTLHGADHAQKENSMTWTPRMDNKFWFYTDKATEVKIQNVGRLIFPTDFNLSCAGYTQQKIL